MQSDWFYQILVILHEYIVLDRLDSWSARLWRALQSNGLDVPDYYNIANISFMQRPQHVPTLLLYLYEVISL